ncbi:MAG: c-type cytochrome [Steroidobacteraceae bacterium]
MAYSHRYRNVWSAIAALVAWCATGASVRAQSAAAEPQSIQCPQNESGLKLPTGFCASIFADGIGHARHLIVAPNGVVYVNTWSGRYYGNGAACTGCHGANASGTPLGPDLADTQWLWGSGSYASISKTITSGVPQPKQFRSPMPPMGGAQLSSGQVSAVAAYIWGLSHRLPATASAGRS